MCPEGAETLPWDITQLPSLGWWWLFSRPVPSDSSRPPGLQHARTPVPYHLPKFAQVHSIESTISSSVAPFSSCPQSFPASGSFPMSQLFELAGQSIGVSASAISPSSEYSRLISFRMDLLAVQGTLKSLLQHHSSKASILWHSAFFIIQISHPYMTTGKLQL